MSPLLLQHDYPLRYGVWRLITLVLACDPLSETADQIGIASSKDLECPHLLLTAADGEILEWIFPTEEDGLLSAHSLGTFFGAVQQRRSAPGSPRSFRFVSGAQLFRPTSEGRTFDLGDPSERQQGLAQYGFSSLDGDDIIWDLGPRRTKGGLTADALLLLSLAHDGPVKEIYLSLYRSLVDPQENEQLAVLLFADTIYSSTLLPGDAKEIRISTVRAETSLFMQAAVSPSPINLEKIHKALRRGLFGETEVSIESLYVPQRACLSIPDGTKGTRACDGLALELMSWWIAENFAHSRPPLLVLGPFGSGKSSLLTCFAAKLLAETPAILPLLIPLRDLREASETRPLSQVLVDHVRLHWKIDLDRDPLPDQAYCILCDGFDELNLYYRAVESDRWVSECFRSLSLLAERKGVHVVISSRPILLMDVRQRSFEGGLCPSLALDPFDRLQIEQWCLNYRRAARLSDFLDVDFLVRRNLFEVARNPLVLYMIGRLFEIAGRELMQDRPYTRAEIYRSFVDWTCRGGYYRDRAKHDVPGNYRQILHSIARLFFASGDGFIEEEKLLAALRAEYGDHAPGRIPIDRDILVAHMLQPVDLHSTDSHHMIEFTHQTFREFLHAEDIWERLSPARQGNDLDSGRWFRLIHKTLSASEIEFLTDLVGELPWAEARHLHKALGETCNVHLYWQRWQKHLWERLLAEPDRETATEIKSTASVAASRASNLATLGTILRIRCFARLRALHGQDLGEELPPPPSSEDLDRLLHFLKVFPELGIGGDNCSLLSSHLHGLCLSPQSSLTGHHLANVSLQGASLRDVNLSGSHWLQADVRDADFGGSRFDLCRIELTESTGASFVDASFVDATLTHSERKSILRADFSGAKFQRARFLDVEIVESRFCENVWESASFLRVRSKTAGILIRCELDDAAERFFANNGFVLEACRRV